MDFWLRLAPVAWFGFILWGLHLPCDSWDVQRAQ